MCAKSDQICMCADTGSKVAACGNIFILQVYEFDIKQSLHCINISLKFSDEIVEIRNQNGVEVIKC